MVQVESELKEVDAKFSRLHGVPAGRALDLYGRVVGGPLAQFPSDTPAQRHPVVRDHTADTTIR